MSGATITSLPGTTLLESNRSVRQSSAISVREPSRGSAQYQTNYETSMAYRLSFENILSLIDDVRPQRVSADEYKVTETLAGPFTYGGLLVLLQEPLWNHPWAEGVDAVVSRCATLNMLREGIWVASNGALSLIDHVSVIDRWPFLYKACHTRLAKSGMLSGLDGRLLQAIRAKKPDVILCMGKVPKEFLQQYLNQLQPTGLNGPKVIFTIHPSYSANYKTGDCLKLRDKLLEDMMQACQFLESRRLGVQQKLSPLKPIFRALPSPILADRTQAKNKDAKIIQEFLDVLAGICFAEGSPTLPVRTIRADQRAPKSYFTFANHHISYLQHSLICYDATPTAKSVARNALIPIFLRLNATLKRVSYFLPVYDADWNQISTILSNVPEDLKSMFMDAGQFRESVSDDIFSVAELFDQLPFPGFEDECAKSIARLERLTFRFAGRATSKSGATNTQLQLRYIPLRGCKCTTRFRFPDIELTRAFDAAYVPEHDCSACNLGRRY